MVIRLSGVPLKTGIGRASLDMAAPRFLIRVQAAKYDREVITHNTIGNPHTGHLSGSRPSAERGGTDAEGGRHLSSRHELFVVVHTTMNTATPSRRALTGGTWGSSGELVSNWGTSGEHHDAGLPDKSRSQARFTMSALWGIASSAPLII